MDEIRHPQGRPAVPADVRRIQAAASTIAIGASGARAAMRPISTGEHVMPGIADLAVHPRPSQAPRPSPLRWVQARAENSLCRFVPFSSLVSPQRCDHPWWRLPPGVAPRRCGVRVRRRARHCRAARGQVQPAQKPRRRSVRRLGTPTAPGDRRFAVGAGPSPASPASWRRPTVS